MKEKVAMEKQFVRWHKKEHSNAQRILTLVLGAAIFLLILPAALFLISRTVDQYVGAARLLASPANLIISMPLVLGGLGFALWSVWAQFRIGRGTPMPMVPTQRLVVSGPYLYCRNPMIFGGTVLYLGLGILVNSASWIVLYVLGLMIPVLVYIKLVEEKELEARFGRPYLAYKRRTPFLIPGIKKR